MVFRGESEQSLSLSPNVLQYGQINNILCLNAVRDSSWILWLAFAICSINHVTHMFTRLCLSELCSPDLMCHRRTVIISLTRASGKQDVGETQQRSDYFYRWEISFSEHLIEYLISGVIYQALDVKI